MYRILLILTTIILGLAACQTTPPPNAPSVQLNRTNGEAGPMPSLSPDEIALGETIYATNCTACHGINLEGQPDWKIQNEDGSFRAPPHDEDGHTWHHGDPTLFESIYSGGARLLEMNIGGMSAMPTYRDILTDEEITAVLTYIKSTWPDDIQQMQWEATLREQARASE
jgi:S-disulfanyl-L-cysteine oxidoreductase SoxD